MQAAISRQLPYGRIGRIGRMGRGRPALVAVGGGAPTASRRRPIRLTRRGRIVVGVLAALLFAGVLAAVLSFGNAVNAAPDSGGSVEIVVERGDTLWSVARRHEPAQDPLVTAEEIRKLNDLSGYTIHPGQRLKLP